MPELLPNDQVGQESIDLSYFDSPEFPEGVRGMVALYEGLPKKDAEAQLDRWFGPVAPDGNDQHRSMIRSLFGNLPSLRANLTPQRLQELRDDVPFLATIVEALSRVGETRNIRCCYIGQ